MIKIPQELVTVLDPDTPDESTTCAVKFAGPGSVGVPVMMPVCGSNVRPGGREPAVIENV